MKSFVGILSVFLLTSCVGPAQSISTAGKPGGDYEAAAPENSNYRIGPGDVLEIFVWRNPEISTSVPVRPDGKISTPLVEDMVAVGKTPSQLARDIEGVLELYVKSPSVNVIVSNFQGTFSGQIRVVGQAANPQSVPYREGMTILDVMIEVGGLGEFAAGNRAKLLRKANGTTVEYRVRLHDLIDKGDIEQNAEVSPGDVLIIPETMF